MAILTQQPIAMHRPSREGLTLVELLVVIVILVMLVGVVLPLAQPALKGREKREAARQINMFCSAAQAKATSTRSSSGIVLMPTKGNPTICEQLVFAKSPPPYSGDNTSWLVGFKSVPVVNTDTSLDVFRLNELQLANDDYWAELTFVIPTTVGGQSGVAVVNNTSVLQRLTTAQPWFEIQLNYRGPLYKGVRLNDNRYYVAMPSDILPPASVITTSGTPFQGGVPFQIFRGPRRSAAATMDLPLGTYIDLTASGIVGGASLKPNNGTATDDPIIVMFDSSGGLGRIYSGTNTSRINAPLLLLTANAKNPGIDNLRPDSGSIWAKVDRRSGSVTTTENLGSVANDFATALVDARASALSGMNMGGR